ncbi:PTS sugar transporter subunit IIA [Mycoplasma capricolum]|uniref:Mannitol-specific phosphotransferase enzyme IIA component n=1 Tax=Mycoplasma capricolum subsp. capripneumoniae 87001 TaxID=1124992 RepID=A0A9N7ASP9_MYCCC|nr:PTS sugar transporter subunit IIA [Mycoplasma capricolum]AJK51498.1 PTS fructose transporter subunit IIA [Mycoplasma capricolum subsp. capripneumoniae 87001]KEY84536.1 Phosphotransferase system PTS, mannitol-permease IIA component [Mycoplasma capricolum subsp. capripneumoniae 99108]UVO24363.1 PTS sugar transporter subunit IIA [Mycoplasma capricolum subsp. capripneumoniae]WGD33035.1 Mannitol-specific phosphotransferase enzyme IIA component [Mycoplasma capricolum subsp. capripneumoniae]CEA109
MIKNRDCIFIVDNFKNKNEAIEFVGLKMVELNYIENKYVDFIKQRDQLASVAIGNYLAIPHETIQGQEFIKNQGIIIVKLNKIMSWDNEKVNWIIGLSLIGDKQIEMLQTIFYLKILKKLKK